ncbi:MAG: HD-GYP domain-containing protein, partial [Halanaerobiales bacterium]
VKERADQDIYKILNRAEEKMYQNKLAEGRSAKSNILNTLLATLGEKSHETQAHARRLEELAFKIGKEINLPYLELDRLSLVASLHDIGKIIVPEDILTKPRKLTKEEWNIIKDHPAAGYRICVNTEEFSHVAKEILSHHERWDGSGYPEGVSGEEIPLLARIISIVDAYDVMTNGRSYKDAMTKKMALTEIERCAGSQFDPELANVFIGIMR